MECWARQELLGNGCEMIRGQSRRINHLRSTSSRPRTAETMKSSHVNPPSPSQIGQNLNVLHKRKCIRLLPGAYRRKTLEMVHSSENLPSQPRWNLHPLPDQSTRKRL